MANGFWSGSSAVILGIAAIAGLGVAIVAIRTWRSDRSSARVPAGSTVNSSTASPAPSAGEPTAAPSEPVRVLDPVEINRMLHELALGRIDERAPLDRRHEAITTATLAALDDAVTQERYAPRRPSMLPRLMSAANNENVSRRELASIIARDPSLVGSLLKIANSSYYRVTPTPVESVDRALALLGTDGLRSLISTALMQPIFRIAGASFPRFPEIAWEHTFRAASAAVPYAVIVEKSDPFAAELLSLLLGLAGIVIFRVVLDRCAREPELRPDARVIASLLDSQSVAVARRIGASWELTERTLSALGDRDAGEVVNEASRRALEFGRLVGALAVLRIYHAIDSETGRASVPSSMPVTERDRMWTRLTAQGIKA